MDPGAALHHYAIAKTCPLANWRCRIAAEVVAKHRAANLTYCDVLAKFGNDPRMETIVAVRGASMKLKELYALKNIADG